MFVNVSGLWSDNRDTYLTTKNPWRLSHSVEANGAATTPGSVGHPAGLSRTLRWAPVKKSTYTSVLLWENTFVALDFAI